MNSLEPTVIYSAANTQQAYLLKGLLEEEGITARVVNDAIQAAGGELPLGWPSAPRVVVGAADAARARQIALNFDDRTAHELLTGDDDHDSDDGEWTDWPRCPECGERRSARCPVCGLSDSAFPFADIEESPEGNRVFLVCQACDDHFLPDWYRLCHRCGHDYGDGYTIETPSHRSTYNAQAWLVLGLMLAGAAAFAGYFVWLFRR